MTRCTFLLCAILFALCGAPPCVWAKVDVSQKTASGIFSITYEESVWVDGAGTLDIAGRASGWDYELASGLRKWPSEDPIGESGGPNLYGYVGNGPIGATDPLGLDVTLIFDRRPGNPNFGMLTMVDNQTGANYTIENVFSGNKFVNDPAHEADGDAGPIPGGVYLLGTKNDMSSHVPVGGENRWYPIYGYVPKKGGWSLSDIPVPGSTATRGGMYFHPGLASNGCVTVKSSVPSSAPGYPKSPDYDRMRDMIEKTKLLPVPNSKGKVFQYSGVLIVR